VLGEGLNIHGARLQIVPTNGVLPHEIADPGREHRIEQRLREDGLLRDPLMVGAVPDLEGYVLLDGTNRQRALKALGYPWVMVQILDYADQHAIRLRTWCHAAHMPLPELLERATRIPGIEVEALSPLAAADALGESATLAVLLDKKQRYLLRRAPDAPSRASQLRRLVDIYEDRMVREDCDPEAAEEHAKRLHESAGHPVTLLAFPPFSRSRVVAMAMQDTPIPAGITRHIVSGGRALRVNLPLAILSLASLDEANTTLRTHLEGLQPRLYREPPILFDS
jgi:ParB-like chromosome segregation protein Spo0J